MNDSQAMVAMSAKHAQEAREKVSLQTYTEALNALRPFAKMYRSGTAELSASLSTSFYIARGTGCDRTAITESDLKRAWEIVSAFDIQPEQSV